VKLGVIVSGLSVTARPAAGRRARRPDIPSRRASLTKRLTQVGRLPSGGGRSPGVISRSAVPRPRPRSPSGSPASGT